MGKNLPKKQSPINLLLSFGRAHDPVSENQPGIAKPCIETQHIVRKINTTATHYSNAVNMYR